VSRSCWVTDIAFEHEQVQYPWWCRKAFYKSRALQPYFQIYNSRSAVFKGFFSSIALLTLPFFALSHPNAPSLSDRIGCE
jgi:hypothetical protein